MPHPKFDYLFTCFDRDRSGRLDVNDFFALGRTLRVASGWAELDPRNLRISRALDAFWEVMLISVDADGSGDVDRDEFRIFEQLMADAANAPGEPAPPWVLELYAAIFEALDADEDGRINLQEYTTYLSAAGSHMDPAAAFAKLDLDGSGFLEVDELELLLTRYFTTTDPDDPANYMLTGGWPT